MTAGDSAGDGRIIIKRTIAACAALLLIVIGFALGPTGARGQATSFRVIGAGVVVSGGNVYQLDDFNAPIGWHQLPWKTSTLPPVQASSLVYYDGELAITDSGEGWGRPGGAWCSAGRER